jgi:hypothetical protein
LAHGAGQWTWCGAYLTIYDDYGTPVNPKAAEAGLHRFERDRVRASAGAIRQPIQDFLSPS